MIMSHKYCHELLIIAILLLSFHHLTVASHVCEVGVNDIWDMKTYVPHNSSLLINCSSDSTTQEAVWSIMLAGSNSIVRFKLGSVPLNRRGLYKLSNITTGDRNIIRLLVNSTEENNGTVVQCVDIKTANIISVTTIMVYDPVAVDFGEVRFVDVQKVNISWSPLQQFSDDPLISYTLMVMRKNTHPQTLTSRQPYFVYTALEGAPPCEVYNFSVTATYVGATYTGAGCNVPSEVVSETLPSLPDISDLQSSLNFSLEKIANHVKLTTTFMPARVCSSFPVINYTLEVKRQSSDDVLLSESKNTSITMNNLQQSSIYTFKIVVRNTFNVASSNITRFYTSDIQSAKVTLGSGAKLITVWCTFISGSDTQGCRVVVVDQSGHELEKRDVLKTSSNNTFSLSSYTAFCVNHEISVIAYDIETDGTIGSLAVPGSFEMSTVDLQELCNENSGTTMLSTHTLYALLAVYCLVVL